MKLSLSYCCPLVAKLHPTLSSSRQEYWSGLSFPSPGDLPDPGTELKPPGWQADSLPLSHLN